MRLVATAYQYNDDGTRTVTAEAKISTEAELAAFTRRYENVETEQW